MSAFIAVRKAHGVEILSDCGGWNRAGVLAAKGSKVIAVGGTGAVIVQRGNREIANRFVRILAATCSTFDEVVARYEAIGAIGRRELGEAFEEHEHYLAGYSHERGRMETYLDTRDGRLHETEPLCAAGPEGALWRFGARFIDSEGDWREPDIANLDLVAEGLSVFEAWRREPVPLMSFDPDSPIVVGVGCGVEHVRIGRRGVEARRLVHRWPDIIGEPIPIAA
jgi:hypothetical protein